MGTPLDTRPDHTPPTTRQPGQFARHPKTGAPWVAHPTDTTKNGWAGTKADLIALCATRGINWESDLDIAPGKLPTVAQLQHALGPCPKKVQYGRPSGLGKQIEDQTNLQKWSERMVSLGIARDPQLAADAAELVHLDPDTAEFKEQADAIARRAKTVAQAQLAAERGTHHHELTEDNDLDRDPTARMAAGEDLGVPTHVQAALLAAWARMLDTFNIDILATEATCVDDIWCQAGTLDRICRLRTPVTFIMPTGELVTLPEGWVGILDIKTGRLRVGQDGFVDYWHNYSVQLASYAQSVPYDPDSDRRGDWPWPIDQRWAVIAHLDILTALDRGEATCRLVLVDLEAGRHAGGLAVAAKAWEKRRDVFSIVADNLTVTVAVNDPGVVVPPATTTPDPCPPAPPPATAGPADTPIDDFDTPLTTSTPTATATAAAPETGAGWLRATQQTIADVDRGADIRRRIKRTPCEGETVHLDDAFNTLQDEGRRLPDAGRLWVGRLVNESMTAGRSFRFKIPGERSARRWWIARGLVTLAAAGQDNDRIVRALLSPIIGPAAFSADHTLGHLVGTLDDSEAARFAGACSAQTSTDPARSVA